MDGCNRWGYMSTLRYLLFFSLFNCIGCYAQDILQSPAVATIAILDTSEILLKGADGPYFSTVAFSSNTAIVLKECPGVSDAQSCMLSVFRWGGGELKRDTPREQVELRSSTVSEDGSRRLLDFDERLVGRWQHSLESAYTVLTLGMFGPEDVNREVVEVVDSATRKSCFEWSRRFPLTIGRPHSAAISPSGEFVAIAAEHKLSIYQLPSSCDGEKVSQHGK